ncbi:MAG: leucine-rich repeat domain-containing protein [Bacteroidaceae bacterium]|nr:leucine-rich repeat domain-containing protein [Bacteroidaceae bacterium]
MKKHILLLFILSLCLSITAKADNIPFVQDGKRWTYSGNQPETNPDKKKDGRYYYYLQGDTIIGDISCLKLYFEGGRNKLSELYEGAMYEEEGRVYFIPEGKTAASLLYDFNCQVGDSIDTFGGTMMVENTKTVGYEGNIYKVVDVQEMGHWIEGIGSIYDLLTLTIPYFGSGEITLLLLSCELNGELIFHYPTFDDREYDGVKAEVEIEGLKYRLYPDYTAMVTNGSQWEGELEIPEKVLYQDETYTVDRLEWLAFSSCKTLTKVKIPKTIADIEHYSGWDACKNPFHGCTALESIEVDEENPWMCSVDGVLFNKEKTWIYSYPAGSKREVYNIPAGVERIGNSVFTHSSHLASVYMPNTIMRMGSGAFSDCKNLSSVRLSENLKHFPAYTFERCENLHFLDIPESVSLFEESVFRGSPIETLVIRGTFPAELRDDTFYAMHEDAVIYVKKSEIEKFQKVFSGTVLPLEEYIADDIKNPYINAADTPRFYDLTGRPVSAPSKGIYIQNGKKVLVK